MRQSLLSIRGLTIEGRRPSGVTQILRGIDVELDRGTVLGLVGESGSGKSTLGMAALGYAREGCRITSGSIAVDGVELLMGSDAQRRAVRRSRVAYVAQSASASFNPARRLSDQSIEVAVGRGLRRREAMDRLMQLYVRLQLPDPPQLARRHPHRVSGGQLQRAMTAMAMMGQPDLIVFDEPTTALDVATQIEVLAVIRDAVESTGTAAIYISHDLALVAQMADRIMVLRHGCVVEEADARQLLRAPREAYTRSIWAAAGCKAAPKRLPLPDAAALLRVANLSAFYGRRRALQDVSFEVHAGRTTAVVGESGSGKSTLAKLVAGVLVATDGAMQFEGRALPASYRRRTPHQLRCVQLISQSPETALNPRQRVREAIGRPLRFYHDLRGAARERRLRELLTDLELDPDVYVDRFPGELSGGQQQRVCIARALAAEPKLIICDEVTSGLDALIAQDTLKLLDRLQQQLDLAYIFITHDLAVVRAIADEVVVLKDGAIVRSGPRDEVLAPPFDAYTELLVSSVPEMDPDWLDRIRNHRRTAQ